MFRQDCSRDCRIETNLRAREPGHRIRGQVRSPHRREPMNAGASVLPDRVDQAPVDAEIRQQEIRQFEQLATAAANIRPAGRAQHETIERDRRPRQDRTDRPESMDGAWTAASADEGHRCCPLNE